MKRVLLCLPEDLLKAIDHEAKAYYMTRSDLMRRALIYYLQPTDLGRRNGAKDNASNTTNGTGKPVDIYTDPAELLKILQHQKLRAGIYAMLSNMKKQPGGRD